MDFLKITNYRVFLRNHLEKRPNRGRGEITKMAASLGVHSTFVSQVLSGTKEFNMEQGLAASEYLEFSKAERDYFLLILQRDRAGTKNLKKLFDEQIKEFKKSIEALSSRMEQHRILSDEDRAIFYSSWIYSGIRMYCAIDSGKTLENICEHFDIGRQKALQVLDFMASRDLVVLNNGKYKMGTQHIHLPKESVFNVRNHMNWRTKALQRHENMSVDEVALTAPMSISKKDFQAIREKIFTCIQATVEIAKNSEAEDVAFLNIDFLWVQPED